MTLARHTRTDIVQDVPDNILNHRVFGRNYEILNPETEYEEDKVVIDKKVRKTAKPKAEPVADNDQENDVDFSSYFAKAGE